MKVLQINSVCGIRSTGRICTDIAVTLAALGHTCKIGYGREESAQQFSDIAIKIGDKKDYMLHALASRVFDNTGFYSKAATKRFLAAIDEYSPDVIHLHNIHGYYINVKMLFDYIKEKSIPCVWTLHDCWAFTGHCTNFSETGCDRWKTGCYSCPLKREYPSSMLFDGSKGNYAAKAKLFSGVEKMHIVTPSEWLAKQVRQSFLGGYSVTAIPNGIDLSVFKPTESNFKEKHGIADKKLILGVATTFSEKKGLSDFYRLASLLGDEYKIALVGLSQEQIKTIPKNILGIERTNSATELAQIYTAADLHLSLSREETMGLTIVEANACGTPVMAYNKTALPENITEKTGIVLEDNGLEQVAKKIKATDLSSFSAQDCIAFARGFEKEKAYLKYIEIYKGVLG